MKKICLVAHLNDLSGANKSLIDLACFLRESFEVVVVVPRKGPLFSELRKRDIKLKIIYSGTWVFRSEEQFLKKLLKKFLLKFSERKFYNFFLRENFSLIYFNSSIYGSGAISAKKLEIPYIWHIRELAEENFSLKFFNRSKTFQLINSSFQVITISNFMKNSIRNDIKEHLIKVVYNGVSPSKINYLVSEEPLTLVIIGAVAPDKGQLDAIRAIKYLNEKMGISIQLSIVGQIINKKYYNQLLSEISADIKHLITFEGYQSNVSNYRKSHYIALVCSKAEAFGRVTIEAMNQHQIVIGANSGATPEIINDGVNGFLYIQGDYISLADTIQKVINLTIVQKNSIIENASDTVKLKFDIKITANRIKKIIDEVILNERGGD